MDIEYIKENYIFEKLNENHDLDDFECESEDLTKFLKEDALNQQNMNLSLTGFYVDKHKFKYLKNDQKEVDSLDRIIKVDPERSFSLYKDIKSI